MFWRVSSWSWSRDEGSWGSCDGSEGSTCCSLADTPEVQPPPSPMSSSGKTWSLWMTGTDTWTVHMDYLLIRILMHIQYGPKLTIARSYGTTLLLNIKWSIQCVAEKFLTSKQMYAVSSPNVMFTNTAVMFVLAYFLCCEYDCIIIIRFSCATNSWRTATNVLKSTVKRL